MEKTLTGYDEIEELENQSIFSYEVYRSMSLFDMKKFIVLEDKLVYVKDNQFKWEFYISEECVSDIKGILNENEALFNIPNMNDTNEEGDNYKFYFSNGEKSHTIYTSNISYPEENGIILRWNSDLDQIYENLTCLLDVFYKIVDVLDSSNLELDIKREFKLDTKMDEPYYKKFIKQEDVQSISHTWILNLDNVNVKYPWNIQFNGSLFLGWANLNDLLFENKKSLMESIKKVYGNKQASNYNVDSLWTLMNDVKVNDIIYFIKFSTVEFRLVVSKEYKNGIIECRKANYLIDTPFNGNRFSKEIITCLSNEDSLIQYFDGLDGKNCVEVFPLHSTINVGPIDVIKEKKIRQQKVYLLSNYKNDGLMTLYKDKIGNYYMSDQNYVEGFSDNYDFKQMEIIEPLEFIIDEGEPIVIQPTDFITRSELTNCRHHKLTHVTARFKVVDEDGVINEVYCPAYYCANCNRYYVLEEDYDRLKNNGIILCKVVGEDYWKESQSITFRGYNEESILHTLGYNVTQKDSLTDKQRWRILEVAVDSKALSKDEILQFLDFLIHSRGNASNMEQANKKWKMDKEHIKNYEMDSHPITVFKKIYLNEYIRLL